MQVICVKEFKGFCQISFEPMIRPAVGDIDTVTDIIQAFGGRYYKLERFGSNENFRVDFFATLPEATADEMQEQEHEAIFM